jgi:hypothetical protein
VKFLRSIVAPLLVIGAAAAVGGCGKSSTPTTPVPTLDTTAPLAPTGLAVVSDPATGLRSLEWTANTEPDLAKYEVYLYSPSPTRDNSYIEVAQITRAHSMRLPVTAAGTTLYYRVRAVDGSGNRSASSAVAAALLEATDSTEPPGGDDPPAVLH